MAIVPAAYMATETATQSWHPQFELLWADEGHFPTDQRAESHVEGLGRQRRCQTNRMRSDLMGVVSATGRPPVQTVHQLSMSLVNALPSRTVPMMNTGQLARDLAVVMNGNGMNMMQIQTLHRQCAGCHALRLVWPARYSVRDPWPQDGRIVGQPGEPVGPNALS